MNPLTREAALEAQVAALRKALKVLADGAAMREALDEAGAASAERQLEKAYGPSGASAAVLEQAAVALKAEANAFRVRAEAAERQFGELSELNLQLLEQGAELRAEVSRLRAALESYLAACRCLGESSAAVNGARAALKGADE